ncbi:hypothetical protein PYCC9005_004069 [Savitreella phatthalungensis]
MDYLMSLVESEDMPCRHSVIGTVLPPGRMATKPSILQTHTLSPIQQSTPASPAIELFGYAT